MAIAASLDRLHARVRANPFLFRFTLGTRLLLALGFIPTGMVKLTGQRFTRLDPGTPVGMLFESLYQDGGLYWHFLGAVQVAAGVLILIPATTTLGAVLFFPFIANIFVITVSYGFKGTTFVTGPMLLAALYLLCWDYDRLRPILLPGRYGEGQRLPAPVTSLGRVWEVAAYAVGGIAGLVLFTSMRFPVPAPQLVTLGSLGLGALAAVVAAAGAWRAMRAAPTRYS